MKCLALLFLYVTHEYPNVIFDHARFNDDIVDGIMSKLKHNN